MNAVIGVQVQNQSFVFSLFDKQLSNLIRHYKSHLLVILNSLTISDRLVHSNFSFHVPSLVNRSWLAEFNSLQPIDCKPKDSQRRIGIELTDVSVIPKLFLLFLSLLVQYLSNLIRHQKSKLLVILNSLKLATSQFFSSCTYSRELIIIGLDQ